MNESELFHSKRFFECLKARLPNSDVIEG